MDLMTLKPDDTPDYMAPAWIGCISFAINTPEIVAEFRKQTGNNWTPGQSGIEQAIDTATGADAAFVESFVRWVNANVWGPVDGPSK